MKGTFPSSGMKKVYKFQPHFAQLTLIITNLTDKN